MSGRPFYGECAPERLHFESPGPQRRFVSNAPHIPDVSLFVPFYSLDPSRQKTCIYPTANPGNPPCRFNCEKSDNERAIQLRRAIIAQADQSVDLDQLIDYALSTCCRSGRAQHRDRIRDVYLVEKLARRWEAEILTNVAKSRKYIAENDSRYFLRPRIPNASINTIPTISSPRYQAPTSEFQPHKTAPGPKDTVAWKIGENLSYSDNMRDFMTGSLYIFCRASSPGFVKIGYTGDSVQCRLNDWSKCGYTPILLYSIGNIPFAHRAESLTHFELTKEWRRERLCKIHLISHQEWFEISKERAIKVLWEWAEFMRICRPYDERGIFIDGWRSLVEGLEKRGETITAEKLLAYARPKVKVEEKEVLRLEQMVGDRQYVQTEPVPVARINPGYYGLTQSAYANSQYVKQEPRETSRPETKVQDRQYVKTEPVPVAWIDPGYYGSTQSAYAKSQHVKQEPWEETRLVQNVRSSSATSPFVNSTLSMTPSPYANSQYIKQEPREETPLSWNVRSSSTPYPFMNPTLSITPSSAKATASKTTSKVSYAATSSATQPSKEIIKSEELGEGKKLKKLGKAFMRLLGKKKKSKANL